MSPDELRKLCHDSWVTSLEGARLSRHTRRQYITGVEHYLAWCAAHGREPDLSRPDTARAWLAELAGTRSDHTVTARLKGLRRFAAWLTEEGELDASGIARVKYPRMDTRRPPALEGGQVRELFAVCAGRNYTDVRDAAILRLMFDSLVRADELLSMRVGDVNIRQRTARVRRGKGGKERITAFGAQTAAALDRYQRQRNRHPLAALKEYWLATGRRGRLSYSALYAMVKRRGEQAGVTVHPHMLRASAAIRWREMGGTPESLQTLAGWSTSQMIRRYTAAAEERLAVAEAHQLLDSEWDDRGPRR